MEIREVLTSYGFDGDGTKVVIGSALCALDVSTTIWKLLSFASFFHSVLGSEQALLGTEKGIAVIVGDIVKFGSPLKMRQNFNETEKYYDVNILQSGCDSCSAIVTIFIFKRLKISFLDNSKSKLSFCHFRHNAYLTSFTGAETLRAIAFQTMCTWCIPEIICLWLHSGNNMCVIEFQKQYPCDWIPETICVCCILETICLWLHSRHNITVIAFQKQYS